MCYLILPVLSETLAPLASWLREIVHGVLRSASVLNLEMGHLSVPLRLFSDVEVLGHSRNSVSAAKILSRRESALVGPFHV